MFTRSILLHVIKCRFQNLPFIFRQIIPQNSKTMFRDLFKDYYDSMAKHLVGDHKSLQNRERQNRQTIGVICYAFSLCVFCSFTSFHFQSIHWNLVVFGSSLRFTLGRNYIWFLATLNGRVPSSNRSRFAGTWIQWIVKPNPAHTMQIQNIIGHLIVIAL